MRRLSPTLGSDGSSGRPLACSAMDLRYTDEEVAFRDELRDWLADAVPAAGTAPDEDD